MYPASRSFSWPDSTLRREKNHCEQPFAFPSSMRVHVTPRFKRHMMYITLSCLARNINRTTTLQMYHTFFVHFFTVFARLRVLWRTLPINDEILFLYLSLDMVPNNSTPVWLAYIWQSKWVGIIAIKIERGQIHGRLALRQQL